MRFLCQGNKDDRGRTIKAANSTNNNEAALIAALEKQIRAAMKKLAAH